MLLEMLKEMATQYDRVAFARCDADTANGLVDKYAVQQVPTVVLFRPMVEPSILTNPEPGELASAVEEANGYFAELFEKEKKRAFADIDLMVKNQPMFIFIKGTQEEPKCKFTRRLVTGLAKYEYKYKTYNILNDERIRQWLKFYSSWPTFPQLFIHGKFQGGIDVITELIENDEFDEMVPEACKKPTPEVEAA